MISGRMIFALAMGFFTYSCTDLSFAGTDRSPTPGIRIMKFGYSMAEKVNEVKGADSTASGSLVGYSNLKYIKEGETRIPGKYKAVMCVTYKVSGPHTAAPVEIEMRTIHPPILNPRTQVTSMTDRWVEEKISGTVYIRGYEFSNDWEIVPGEWVFEFWCNGRMLASKKFIVYPP